MLNLDIGTPLLSKQEMHSFLAFAAVTEHLAVDTESDPDTSTFLGISCAFPGMGTYFPVGHLEEDVNIDNETFDLLMYTLQKTKLRVMHNAAHDLTEFEKIGFPLNGRFADTMIMAHMVDENVLSKSLDYLHKHYTGGEGKNKHELAGNLIKTMGWRYVPVALMNEYGTQDAVATSELFTVLLPLYEKEFGPLFND